MPKENDINTSELRGVLKSVMGSIIDAMQDPDPNKLAKVTTETLAKFASLGSEALEQAKKLIKEEIKDKGQYLFSKTGQAYVGLSAVATGLRSSGSWAKNFLGWLMDWTVVPLVHGVAYVAGRDENSGKALQTVANSVLASSDNSTMSKARDTVLGLVNQAMSLDSSALSSSVEQVLSGADVKRAEAANNSTLDVTVSAQSKAQLRS